MDYDLIFWLSRRRWKPRKHAARRVGGEIVSLCGDVDTRLWKRGRRVACKQGSIWIYDVTCDKCLALMRRAREAPARGILKP